MSLKSKPIKVVALGDSMSGKTSLLSNIRGQNSPSDLGVELITKEHSLPNGQIAKFQIWDTAGAEKYRPISQTYYKFADVALLIFDITCTKSFDHLKSIAVELLQERPNGLFIFVVGNKVDLIQDEEIPYETAKHFAQSLNAIFHYTSAKSKKGINELLTIMAQKIIINRSGQPKQTIKIDVKKQNKKPQYSGNVKAIAIGNLESGKSELLQNYLDHKEPTIGSAFIVKQHHFGKNQNARIQIWDTAGQQKYRSLSKIYYRDTNVALLIYDNGSEKSYDYIKHVAQLLRQEGPQNLLLIAVCTHINIDNQRVDHQTVKNWIQSLNGILHYACEKKGKEELLTIMAERFTNANPRRESIALSNYSKKKKEKAQHSCIK